MSGVYAQQDAQFTQYMYNTINVNPAYAGSRGVISAFVLHRTQWVGLDGAPLTNTASIHTPIEGSNLGVGLSLVNDRIGISDENNIAADVSYTIETSEDYKLSFGLKFTANLLSVDFNRLTLRKPGDYAISQQYNINNKFSPNIGAGIYYYSDKSYVGISAPQFLETKQYSDNSTSVATERMHFYLISKCKHTRTRTARQEKERKILSTLDCCSNKPTKKCNLKTLILVSTKTFFNLQVSNDKRILTESKRNIVS
jgi:type IX secretion system PorP/SprF family membrane protein